MPDDMTIARIEKLEQQIAEINIRNQRVENDKAWEGSRARILIIMAMTYILVTLVFYLVAIPNYWFNALIPTLGFFLSTQTMPMIKHRWLGDRRS